MERLDVKKSVKHKPPVIRQTLTSIYRIAKANPLLFVDDAPKVNNAPLSLNLKKTKLPNSFKPITKTLTENIKKGANKTPQVLQTKPKVKPAWNSNVNITNNGTHKKKVVSIRPPLMHSTATPKPKSNLIKPKVNFVTPTSQAKPKPTKVKRRSLSADHYERKKSIILTSNTTQSETNLLDDNFECISPIQERRVTFRTPPAHESRCLSVAFTPTPYTRKHSTPYIMRTNYQLSDLHKRLTKWLRLRKKPVDSYSHLKSFGSNKDIDNDDENKENVEGEYRVSSSYEDLGIITPVTPKKELEDVRGVVQGVLSDLHKLILEGFSIEQSEGWLNILSQKYSFLEEEPQYWECRAAIEQNRGNIVCAVEFLRTAIVQGAEVNSVDQSLEQLLQKFSLLNITTQGGEELEESAMKNDRARIVTDARNVFKSSIIQFAIQERNLKKNTLEANAEKKFVATPVRRSTRLTPSRYRVTPKVQVCSSLFDLDDGVRCNMDFCSNKQLNVRFGNLKKKKD